MTELIFLLLLCHFLGDFTPLSNAWMQKAKQFGKTLIPILAHAMVHALLMLGVLLFYASFEQAFLLSSFQLMAHFGIDTLKGRLNSWFPILLESSKKGYWVIFGLDQLLHQITILLMVSYLK